MKFEIHLNGYRVLSVLFGSACTDWTSYVENNPPNCLIIGRLRAIHVQTDLDWLFLTIVQVDRVGLAPVGSAIPTLRADGLQTYNPLMGSSHSPLWSIGPALRLDRRDPYLRLQNVTLFVRDQHRSLQFFVDRLGFSLVADYDVPG